MRANYPRDITPQESELLAAQRIACGVLVNACRAAIFDFALVSAYPEDAREERISMQAVEILQDILRSWRETLSSLETIESWEQRPDGSTLERFLQANRRPLAGTGTGARSSASSRRR